MNFGDGAFWRKGESPNTNLIHYVWDRLTTGKCNHQRKWCFVSVSVICTKLLGVTQVWGACCPAILQIFAKICDQVLIWKKMCYEICWCLSWIAQGAPWCVTQRSAGNVARQWPCDLSTAHEWWLTFHNQTTTTGGVTSLVRDCQQIVPLLFNLWAYTANVEIADLNCQRSNLSLKNPQVFFMVLPLKCFCLRSLSLSLCFCCYVSSSNVSRITLSLLGCPLSVFFKCLIL